MVRSQGPCRGLDRPGFRPRRLEQSASRAVLRRSAHRTADGRQGGPRGSHLPGDGTDLHVGVDSLGEAEMVTHQESAIWSSTKSPATSCCCAPLAASSSPIRPRPVMSANSPTRSTYDAIRTRSSLRRRACGARTRPSTPPLTPTPTTAGFSRPDAHWPAICARGASPPTRQ